jgi:Outer membrane protein beta-barrel domain
MNRFAVRRPRLHCALFALLLFALSIPAARAQTAIYGQFSAARFNTDTVPKANNWGYGGGFGLYSDFYKLPFAKLGGDIRFQFVRPADNTTLFSTLLGPRLALHPKVVPLNPYAEFLFGAGRFTYGNNSPSTTQFDWRALGGVDKTLLPHLDWRIIEVSYGQLNTYSGRLRPVTFSTGIVLRLN